jgi:hypothetical protein
MHDRTAVSGNRLAGNKAGIAARQEVDNIGNIFGHSVALDEPRILGRHDRRAQVRGCQDAFGNREAWRNRVDANSVISELICKRARHSDNGTLARDIVQHPGSTLEGCSGRYIHDPAKLCRAHMRGNRTAHPENPDDIDIIDAAPFLRRKCLEGCRLNVCGNGSIIDEDIDPAAFCRNRPVEAACRELMLARKRRP